MRIRFRFSASDDRNGGPRTTDAAAESPQPLPETETVSTRPAPPTYDGPYSWINDGDTVFGVGATVSLVKGLSPEAALAVLDEGAVTEIGPAAQTWSWFLDHVEQSDSGYLTYAVARSMGDWTLVVQESDYTASFLVDALAAGGEAVVIYCSIDALMSFNYGLDGEVVRSFDPLLFDPAVDGPGALPAEAGLEFGVNSSAALPLSFQLAERLTGVTLTPVDLASPADGVAVVVHHT